jgi:hypothetical protein
MEPVPSQVKATGIAILLIGLAVASLAYVLNRNYNLGQETLRLALGPTQTPSPLLSPTPEFTTPAATSSATLSATLKITPRTSSSVAPSPAVVIQGEAGLDQKNRAQLRERVINPFVDYYQEADQGKLKSISVETNTNPNYIQYPYKIDAVFDNGVTQGFLVEKKGSEIQWWKPICMGDCPFSESYQNKYPEVVKP